MTDTSNYIGDELTLFGHAKNWKNYWGGHVRCFLGTRVLEVGAGLGGTTQYLNAPEQAKNYEKWLCLEPDATLAQQH